MNQTCRVAETTHESRAEAETFKAGCLSWCVCGGPGGCCASLLHARGGQWCSESRQEALPPNRWEQKRSRNDLICQMSFRFRSENSCFWILFFASLHQKTPRSLWPSCRCPNPGSGWCCGPWIGTVQARTAAHKPGSACPTAWDSSICMPTAAGQLLPAPNRDIVPSHGDWKKTNKLKIKLINFLFCFPRNWIGLSQSARKKNKLSFISPCQCTNLFSSCSRLNC